ncbi:hypothetical protein BPMI_02144c [Candidatus Burkholderia pumila]|uniref:GH15-like domain-containing protein n=1 Tax=Candidatus Burkholderia pumila TaxID=1090375 RepID=A0ABR5HP40_9BURK|nr:hypothetical protein BPMI_02144c [Candidatus Burkholderia pumila]
MNQTQNDIFGECLLALHSFLETVNFELPPRIEERLPEAVRNLAERAFVARGETDHGIWELRTGKQHTLDTKALIWVVLVRAVNIGRKTSSIDENTLNRW